jgi:hypothetical protein
MDLYNQIYGDSWKENIVLASVPLWKYNGIMPIANASGCIVEYAGAKFLLSIAHATIADSEWCMEIKSVDSIGGIPTTVLQPVMMNSLREVRFIPEKNDFTEIKIVDFTYRKLPSSLTSDHVIAIVGDQQVISAERTIFKTDFEVIPDTKKRYGFYGNVNFSGVKGRRIVFEHRLEYDLSYIKTEGEYHVFKLPHKYGAHSNYQGCSGAPIIDSDNNIVALVAFGERSTNSIYGIDISKYKATLEIEAK